MGKQFGKGSKRRNNQEKFGNRRHVKNKRVKEVVPRSPSPTSSGESSGEQSSDGAHEEVVYREPSNYDNLLMKLGSSNKSFADVYKKRQRQEEGKSDSEEDEADNSESISLSEEDDEDKGNQHDSLGSDVVDTKPQEPSTNDVGDQSDFCFFKVLDVMPRSSHHKSSKHSSRDVRDYSDSEKDSNMENGSEASDTDQEHALVATSQSSSKTSISTSALSEHLGYQLSKEDIEDLSKCKWQYKWEVPATDMANCKWRGTGECLLHDGDIDYSSAVKTKLYKHWLDAHKSSGGKDFYSSKWRGFFALCNSYRDILHFNKKPFYHKGKEEDSTIMDAYLMHSLNHIFRTRDLVTKNDAKAAKQQESAKDEIICGDGFLDHGFTRPKVLILLPYRSIAFRVVKRLVQLTPEAHKVNVEHIDRFYDEFGVGGDEAEEDQNMNENGNSKFQKSSKSADHQALFGGNSNDEFMIGIKFTRKSIKLYGDFYSSDMIIASPVKIQMAIGKAEEDKERDVDFLSSIEVLIIDHADVISMQNWSFLTSVVEHLNRIPSKQHGTDVMRIRPWYLDGQARFYRQSIILSYYLTPDMNALFNHHCLNYRGKVRLTCEHKGVLQKVLLQVRQIYERFDANSIVDADDARLEYFAKKIFPKIKDSVQGGIMIFINSYFEFVRLRNFLKAQNASFSLLGEYTKPSDISRARVWFFEGNRKIMLYTERAYFYKRYKIRGMQNLLIYSLPERKEFYPEIVNMLEGSHDMTCTVLFSRFDQLRLERIVGSASSRRMINSDKSVFVFC